MLAKMALFYEFSRMRLNYQEPNAREIHKIVNFPKNIK